MKIIILQVHSNTAPSLTPVESDDNVMSSQPSDGPQGRENENFQRKVNNIVRGGDLEGFVAVLLGLIENEKSSQLKATVKLASKILGGRG